MPCIAQLQALCSDFSCTKHTMSYKCAAAVVVAATVVVVVVGITAVLIRNSGSNVVRDSIS